MRNTGLFFLLVILSFSCNNNEFKTHKSGLEYRFIEQNTETEKPEIGDGLVIRLKYTSPSDSVIFNGPFRVLLRRPSHKGGSIEDAFAMMHQGDSAEFLIDAEKFVTITTGADIIPDFVKKGSKLKFFVRLKDILKPDEMAQIQADLNTQKKAAEIMLLDDYIERNEIKVEPNESGLYKIILKKGKGKQPATNDSVTVHYTGMFLDGSIFDSSIKRNQEFSFTLGKNEVIKGWEEGVSSMKKGEKARFIIPSALAYEKKGYGELIPPFTTLVFEVELLKINGE